MNWIKENLKSIVLSLAILVTGILISEGITDLASSYRQTNLNNSYIGKYPFDKTGYSLTTYEQNFESRENYTHTCDTGRTEIWVDGERHEYFGTQIEATYFHVGQMLRLFYVDDQHIERYVFFTQPDKWQVFRETELKLFK